jgi:type IV secretory pathway VirB2 component (pilin)
MKKYLLYILILIISVGVFSIKTFAQTPTPVLGTCTGPSGQQYNNISADNCAVISGTWTGSYNLLAPLPCPPGSTGCTTDAKGNQVLSSFDPTGPGAIGTYLNIIIKIIIGIAAVMAVIMIVIGGIEYMTSELISGKEAGKERITNAIFGLLIALGSWALLNTINPDLLNTSLGSLTTATVNVVFQPELDAAPPSLAPYTGTLPSGPLLGCPGGITKSTNTGIVACSSIASNLDQMIVAAKQAGFNIYAGGYRSDAQQTALRQQNCNGNTTDRSATCNPPTALPGYSEHNSGLAFDVACNGSTVTSKTSPCFNWLQNNAATYGLKNLTLGNEPWHWSVDGR